MTGVPRSVAEHQLNIREGYSPVRQKKRGQALNRAKAIQAEDCYPLPEIDWKVESLCGYPFKYFLDTYKGYHQIQMAESDEEKTAFHTSQGVYVDDLVIKSYTEVEMLRDIEETFRTLRKINMKLNPKKCTFGAVEGMFLGYTITLEGIKPCPDKTEAVLQLPSPQTIKEMPVYFVSRTLQGPELNYTPMEKLVLSLVFAAKRLRRTITKVERHAGRTQYHIPAKDVGERTKKADFLIEKPDENPPDTSVLETPQEPWTLFTDGSSCVDGSGAGLILTSLEGTEFTYALRFQFTASNNEAEYEALIAGLWIAVQMGVCNVYVLVEILKEKSIKKKEVTNVVEEDGPTQMTPIIEYLKDGTLPDDKKEASKLHIKARQYELLEGIPYRRSFLKPWLRCVGPLQANYVIREIHEGSFSMHPGPRSVVAKAIRLGYY
ncbi:reverse transcriptase domain-containing protein [Tanacetum coccineum]